jgi:hypothetical protein
MVLILRKSVLALLQYKISLCMSLHAGLVWLLG